MGQSDYRKINDRWCADNENENRARLDKFYFNDESSSNGKSKKGKKKKIKANHPHEWEEVILAPYKDRSFPLHGKRCKVCGLVDYVGLFVRHSSMALGWTSLMFYNEIKELYSDWPIIEEFDWN